MTTTETDFAAELTWTHGAYRRTLRATRDDPAEPAHFEDFGVDREKSDPETLAAFGALSDAEQIEITDEAHDRALRDV